jgi:hypothetical protein
VKTQAYDKATRRDGALDLIGIGIDLDLSLRAMIPIARTNPYGVYRYWPD